MTRVVLSGIYYPMAILRYFEGALRSRKDVDLITVGPYTANHIPWKGGMFVPEKYAKAPDYEIPLRKGIPLAAVEAKIEEDYDVWIQVDADFHLTGKPTGPGVKHFIVGTDPHCVNYDYQRTTADVFFNMQKCYSNEGDVYLPYAYDPVWHSPPVEPVEKVYDVALVGLMYDHRRAVIEALRARGHKIYFDTGPIFEEARDIYHRSKVGFNWSSLYDLNARAFELLALGLPTVMNKVPDIDLFFQENVDYAAFSTASQAVKQIEQLLEMPDLGDIRAMYGLAAVKPHTWGARVEQLLSYL